MLQERIFDIQISLFIFDTLYAIYAKRKGYWRSFLLLFLNSFKCKYLDFLFLCYWKKSQIL